MKGVVFTEFLDFVAAGHGEDLVDEIVVERGLQHGVASSRFAIELERA